MEINTSCKDCCFANWQDKTQIGCSLARLERFRSNGAEVAVNTDEESGLTHFVIKGRECVTWRDKDWVEKLDMGVVAQERALSECVVPVTVIGYIGRRHKMYDVKRFIRAIQSQEVKPKEIILLNCSCGNIKGPSISNLLDKLPITWKNSTLVGEPTKNEAVDSVIKKVSSTYYTLFNVNYQPPKEFIKRINDSLLLRCERWILAKPNKAGEGLVVNTLSAKSFENNRPMVVSLDGKTESPVLNDIAEKLEYIANATEQKSHIKKIEDLCVSMSQG